MSRWFDSVSGLAGCTLFLACLALAGCRGCSSSPPTGVGVPATQPASAVPVVVVRGAEGVYDFGSVQPGSKHEVEFVVENPSDRAIRFKTVRPDCECISADSQPTGVEAGSSVRIAARYEAPKTSKRYEAQLIIVTDAPDRRMILLKVSSGPKEQ